MEMLLTAINDLLQESKQYATAFRLNTHEQPQRLSVVVEYQQSTYRLLFHLSDDGKSWNLSEWEASVSSVTSESFQKESQSTKCPAASCCGQLSLWPLESNK